MDMDGPVAVREVLEVQAGLVLEGRILLEIQGPGIEPIAELEGFQADVVAQPALLRSGRGIVATGGESDDFQVVLQGDFAQVVPVVAAPLCPQFQGSGEFEPVSDVDASANEGIVHQGVLGKAGIHGAIITETAE